MLKITHLFTISAVPNIFFRSEKEQKVFFRHMVHHLSTAILTSGYFTPNSISELRAIMCKKNRRLTQAGKPLSSKRLLNSCSAFLIKCSAAHALRLWLAIWALIIVWAICHLLSTVQDGKSPIGATDNSPAIHCRDKFK